jgi:hypothetical protein
MPIEFGHAIDKYLEKLYERPDIFVRKMKKSNYTELIEEYNKQILTSLLTTIHLAIFKG